jgi:hypothetical protein
MVIVDTPHGAAVLDWRGYHKMDPEKLHRRLYGSFANWPGKLEGDNTGLQMEDNTQEGNDGGTNRG